MATCRVRQEVGLWGAVPGRLAEGTQLKQRVLVHRWVCEGEMGAPGIVTSHVLSCECAPGVQALLWGASSNGAAQGVCGGGRGGGAGGFSPDPCIGHLWDTSVTPKHVHCAKLTSINSFSYLSDYFFKKPYARDFPGGPVVKTQRFHCLWARVQSLVGELRSYKPCSVAKTNKQNLCHCKVCTRQKRTI